MTTPEIQAHFDRGRAYVENGDYDRAIVELTQAIELFESAERDPFEAELHAWRGLAYHYKGVYDYAMEDLSIATVWKHNDYSEAFAVRAEIALKIGDYGSAVDHFRRAKAGKKAQKKDDSPQGTSDSMSISYTHTPRFRQVYGELVKQEELYNLYERPLTDAKIFKRLEVMKQRDRELQEREQREAGKDWLEVLNERLEENPYSLNALWHRFNYYEEIGEEEKARRDRKRYCRLGGRWIR